MHNNLVLYYIITDKSILKSKAFTTFIKVKVKVYWWVSYFYKLLQTVLTHQVKGLFAHHKLGIPSEGAVQEFRGVKKGVKQGLFDTPSEGAVFPYPIKGLFAHHKLDIPHQGAVLTHQVKGLISPCIETPF